MSVTTYRCSFTLPVETAVLLSEVSKRFGVSQSAVLAVILDDALTHIATAQSAVVTEHGVTRRLIGDAAAGIRDTVLQALGEGRDIARQLDWVAQ